MAIILFRRDLRDSDNEQEFIEAQKNFTVIENRGELQNHKDQIVIARYSALPYYKELEEDCHCFNCNLINSYQQHRWIANFEYYEPLKEYTPETWEDKYFHMWKYDGPFVVKGKTNSRKHRWNKDMYAEDRRAAMEVVSRLKADMWICEQDIIIRKFIPLKTFEKGIFDLPFTNEFRFFYYKTTRISYEYYWSIAENPELGKMDQEGLDFADKIAKIASNYTNFFVLDIAEKEEGGWILIEINDGQQSGLSMIEPSVFYKRLAEVVNENSV